MYAVVVGCLLSDHLFTSATAEDRAILLKDERRFRASHVTPAKLRDLAFSLHAQRDRHAPTHPTFRFSLKGLPYVHAL